MECVMSVDCGFGGVIVPFARVRTDMTKAIVDEVRTYWEALRAGRPVPLRSEVDPRGIEGALDCSFILERMAPRVARFRVAGGHLNDLMGMEVRGMPLTAMFSPASRGEVGAILADVFFPTGGGRADASGRNRPRAAGAGRAAPDPSDAQ